MERIKTDILVIGGGSGGLSVAAGAAQMGADVVLLEGHKMGGDCLNYGCVPSKALLSQAKRAHGGQSIDYAGALTHVAQTIATIEPHDSVARFEGLGVRVIQEYGRFVARDQVEAGDHVITARRIVIATGSSPMVPPIPGLDQVPYDTNETLFTRDQKPDHLLIIGGGPIGMEMAQAHRRLGCEVTVIEGARALGRDDPEAAEIVLGALRSEGVEIAEGALVEHIRGVAGAIEVVAQDGRVFKGTDLLVAVGRKPNIDKLNLEAAGIATNPAGITVNASLKTSNRRVYAIGDVTGGAQFTHVAGYHAGVVIRSALFGLPAKAGASHIPYATYTDPELAQIGPTEAQARETYGDRLEVARFDYSGNDRAIAEGKTDGFVKVMVVKGRPVGATIVGHQAGEHINLWALALANRMKMGKIVAMVSPYPSLGEINKRAVGAYFSPRLFDSKGVKRMVGLVQAWLP